MALKKSLPSITNADRKAGVQDEIEKLEKELNSMKAKS
jgi:hypothetical protein